MLALSLTDIPWLRRAAAAGGTLEIPGPVATKLLAGKLVEQEMKRGALMITTRGKLALARLA